MERLENKLDSIEKSLYRISQLPRLTEWDNEKRASEWVIAV